MTLTAQSPCSPQFLPRVSGGASSKRQFCLLSPKLISMSPTPQSHREIHPDQIIMPIPPDFSAKGNGNLKNPCTCPFASGWDPWNTAIKWKENKTGGVPPCGYQVLEGATTLGQ